MKTPKQTGPRLEMKTSHPMSDIDPLVDWLRQHMTPDVHTRKHDGTMDVVTLYFDSPDRVCYRGRAKTALPKHRLRQYDGTSSYFLEEKFRRENRVWKRRLPVDEDTMTRILQGDPTLNDEPGWFRSRFQILDLGPSLLISYRRRAFVSDCGARVTLDDRVHAHVVSRDVPETGGFRAMESLNGHSVITQDAVFEVKGPIEPTPLMRQLIEHTSFREAPFSKYSKGLEAAGLEVHRPASGMDPLDAD